MEENQNQKRSPLESLQEKLYQPGAQIGERPKTPEVFAPKEAEPERVETKWRPEESEQFMTIKQIKKKKILSRLFILFTVLAVAAAVWFGYIYFFQIFSKSDVIVKIKGPETVESGENIQFFVTYQNKSKFNLKNAVLVFTWPDGAKPKDSAVLKIEKRIGNVFSGRDAMVSFDGQFFGAKNDKFAVSALLKYSPEDQTQIYEAKSSFESVVSKTPFSIVMSMPSRAVSGNEIEVALEYQNLSEIEFPDMQLKMEYPEGFVFASAEPAPSAMDNIWEFNEIKGREVGKIKIKGTFSGRDNEIKLLQAAIGKAEKSGEFITYAGEEISTVISSTALFVYQTVNGSRELSASLGDKLNYKIIFRNTTDVAIPNAVVSVSLDGKVVDLKSLDINWGSYSGVTNSIIWNASGVPQLALLSPGEEGDVSFSVRLIKSISMTNIDKNLTISSIAKITTDQVPGSLIGIPIGNEDKIEVKLNTNLVLVVSGFYKNNAPIENSGPIPPKVGQKTSYNIVWQLTNMTNDADNVRIEAILPPHIQWENRLSPSDANISFEQSTGKVVWDVGRVSAGTGFVLPVKQVAFQISITPTITDFGRSPALISTSSLSGLDLFTNISLTGQNEGKNIYLTEDSYIIENRGWTVVQ